MQLLQDAQIGHQRSTILSFEPTLHSQKPTSRPLKWRFHLAKAKVGENSTNYTRKHQHCQMSRNAIGAAEPRRLLLHGLPHSIIPSTILHQDSSSDAQRARQPSPRPANAQEGGGGGQLQVHICRF